MINSGHSRGRGVVLAVLVLLLVDLMGGLAEKEFFSQRAEGAWSGDPIPTNTICSVFDISGTSTNLYNNKPIAYSMFEAAGQPTASVDPNTLETPDPRKCDDFKASSDQTPGAPEWVVADYTFTMLNMTGMRLDITWSIHEFDSSDLDLGSVDLGGGFVPGVNGIPADIIRNLLDVDTSGDGVTIEETLIGTIKGSVEQFTDGIGQRSTPVSVSMPIAQNTDFRSDSAGDPTAGGEGQMVGNVFDPPLVFDISTTIDLNADQFALTDALSEGDSLDRTVRGILIMGGEITVPFDLITRPGHASTFDLYPPDYAQVVASTGPSASLRLNPKPHARWELLDLAGATSASINESVTMTMASQEVIVGGTRVVNLDRTKDQGLGISVRLDLSADNWATITVDMTINYVDNITMDAWNLSVFESDGQASLPVVTSDGMRMAYHMGLLELSALSDAIPVGQLANGLGGMTEDEIVMDPVEWEDASLNYSHDPLGETQCQDPPGVSFCTDGPYAMNSTIPVRLSSSSQPFRMRLLDLIQGQGGEGGPIDFATLQSTDLESILNSGLTIETDLGSSFVEDLVPDDLPPTELQIAIDLPRWVQTKDGENTLVLAKRVGGTTESVISVMGTSNYDWRHAIIDPVSRESICPAHWKTCMTVELFLDFKDLSVNEWSQEISLTLGGYMQLDVYRVEIPSGSFPSAANTSIEFEVMPSDLIRKFIEIGGRSTAGSAPLSFPLDLMGNSRDLSLTKSGLSSFLDGIASDVTDKVRALELSDAGVDADLGGITFAGEIDEIEPPATAAMQDRDPVRLRFTMLSTKIDLQYRNGGIALDTNGAWTMNALQSFSQGISQSLIGGVPLASSSQDGLVIPPSDGEYVTIPDIKPFSLSMDESNAGPSTIAPKVIFTVRFPEGLGFKEFRSQLGKEKMSTEQGRQQVTYSLPPEGQTDEVQFSIVVSWGFLMGELGGYVFGAGGIVALLVFSRVRKRKGREKILEKEFENASKLRTSETEFTGMGGFDGGDDTGGSPPPPPRGAPSVRDDDWGADDWM